MINRRFILTIVILVAVAAVGLVVLARTPFLVHSAGMISRPLFGYHLAADSFSFNPLKADIRNLTVVDSRRGNFLFTAAAMKVATSTKSAFKGDVEKIELRDAKIRIRIGEKKETQTDLSFIKNIPEVHLLTMQNGEFSLHFKGSPGTVSFRKINLTVRNFSPDTGGSLTFTGEIVIDQPGGSGLKATGTCKGQLNLTGILPDLIGKGTVEAMIDTGSAGNVSLTGVKLTLPVSFEKERVVISRASVAAGSVAFAKDGRKAEIKNGQILMNAVYQASSGSLSSDSLQVIMPGVGTIRGTTRMTLKGTMPLAASVETKEVNFSSLFGMVKTLLTQEEAKKWSIEGAGALKVKMAGNLGGKAPSVSGTATLDVRKGGFSSPDGSKAAQGINGTVIINFSLPKGGNKDASMKVSSRVSSGEYLWGKYYKDLRKEPSTFSSKTDITISSAKGSRFKGTCDLFNTGTYSYDGFFGADEWALHVAAAKVGLKRVVTVFAADYLAQLAPGLKGLDVGGVFDADVTVTSRQQQMALAGTVKLSGASVNAPAMELAVKGLDIDVPFDIASVEPAVPADPLPDQSKLGMITVTGFSKGSYSLAEMRIPVVATGTGVAATGIISVPFYGGNIRLRGLQAKEVLGQSPKVSFAASIDGIDFPRLLNDATGLTFPGTVKARIPNIAFQNGEVMTQGKTVIDIFGGKIEAVDIYAKNVFAPSRQIGGDIIFSNIDLGKITETIKVGKITGVVEGSMKGLVIEYGQPSRFVFDLDTVAKSGVSQKVSVDAIENISILGTGSGGIGAVLKSGINKFFKEYPYSRIGIRCTLENDNFNVRGKIVEGGTEYLIRRAFLRGIDVVNKDPNNVVSFKDMQERVGRVFNKEKDGSGPTIKVN